MKGLEQYIEANAIYEELVNMQFTETQSVDEGLLDFFKKMSGKFSKAKNAVKATGTVLSDRIKKIYKDALPEWWKEFERLTQLDDEKKRIEIINKITKLIDDTESKILSDEQKTAIKMILQKQEVDLSKAAGQGDAQKQAEEQLKTLVKDNPEQAKEVTADLKKQGYEAPAAEGEGGESGEGQPANDGKPTDDPSQNLGTNDENAVVTPEQEKTGVQQTIKDEANFISPLAKRAGIDGQALSNYVTGIINKAFKEPIQDEKTGEAVLKWKNGAVQSIAQNDGGEARLVDGISAIISGLLILKSQNAIDAVLNIEELDPKGVSGKLNKLQKELSQVDAGVKEHRISLEDFVNKK